jgi:class 3 adenylate cyclase
MAEPATPGRPVSETRTFLFADLAGFTALTEVHGDEEGADLVVEFAADVRSVLDEHGATEVKTIGDAVMLLAPVAGDAVRLGLRLAHEIGGCHGLPSVRVGMHSGPAIEREGDWFGTAVNVAARVAGLAGGDQVLLSDATRRLAGPLDGVELRSLGSRPLRNIAEPLSIYEAVSIERAGNRLPIDPVCLMAVDPAREAGRLSHGGAEYHFCSLRCARSFAEAPDAFAAAQSR